MHQGEIQLKLLLNWMAWVILLDLILLQEVIGNSRSIGFLSFLWHCSALSRIPFLKPFRVQITQVALHWVRSCRLFSWISTNAYTLVVCKAREKFFSIPENPLAIGFCLFLFYCFCCWCNRIAQTARQYFPVVVFKAMGAKKCPATGVPLLGFP